MPKSSSDPCQVDFVLPPEAQGARAPESRAIVFTLWRGFSFLAKMLRYVADVVMNTQVLSDAAPFTIGRSNRDVPITPGTVTEIYASKSRTEYTAVYISAETYASGTSALLMVDDERAECTAARARVKKYGAFPSVTVHVPPNGKLYADITDSSVGQQATFRLTVTEVPLYGAGLYFQPPSEGS